ncbi:MAG: TIGR00730 family Rossman fold protein [Bryobacteraceae bacterium]|nr:TIGR00730 family Rossman fold protein [Bryobacteraceae bacterium]
MKNDETETHSEAEPGSETPAARRLPLAYRNERFMESSEARSVRILSEYLYPLGRFRREKLHDTIVFFGSARICSETHLADGSRHPLARYYDEARELARLMTVWSDGLTHTKRRFVVTTGGGPGIMEAANRGARDAGGKTMGLNIALPFEQEPNPYLSPELTFEFHYFFMRKFWFAYLAKALVVFPGGFGTFDELFELLTLAQTHKLDKQIVIVLYGTDFWKEALNLEALARQGLISPEDLRLFHYADTPPEAFEILRDGLSRIYLQPDVEAPVAETLTPDIARSRV